LEWSLFSLRMHGRQTCGFSSMNHLFPMRDRLSEQSSVSRWMASVV
jgi:hypothetical protein